MRMRITTAPLGALIMLVLTFGSVAAQEVRDKDVAILNDHLQTHEVFVFDAHGGQHVLGFVGHDQFKYFDVPDDIEAMGPYRIALQQYLPEPQLGVPVDAFPYKMTPTLSPTANETVSIIVGPETELSSVQVLENAQHR